MIAKLSRRGLLRTAGAGVAGFTGLRTLIEKPASAAPSKGAGYGALIPDDALPALLDLPPGFQYRAFSRTGEVMDDGYRVPGAHDGMAAFPGPNGTTILVRNHEMGAAGSGGVAGTSGSPYFENEALYNAALVYDPSTGARPALGGTTNLIYNTFNHKLEKHYLSLTGTLRNCAGGPTPWGTWITCEETTVVEGGNIGGGVQYAKNHGYVFEVAALAAPGVQTPVPLKALGRFNHEALAVDPRTRIVYETEDEGSSLFYRFLPGVPGNLQAGGRLQALKIAGLANPDTSNRPVPNVTAGVEYEVTWVDLIDVEEPDVPLRTQGAGLGAAIFSRGEGAWWGNGACYFACTNGGAASLGQIFKYTPSPFEGTSNEVNAPGILELFIESTSASQFAAPDNIAIAPWGDVIICEDGSGDEFVHGVTPAGEVYKLARNAFNGSEFAGACFSPDGSTLFVNIQSPGITYAITGPWHRRAGGNPE